MLQGGVLPFREPDLQVIHGLFQDTKIAFPFHLVFLYSQLIFCVHWAYSVHIDMSEFLLTFRVYLCKKLPGPIDTSLLCMGVDWGTSGPTLLVQLPSYILCNCIISSDFSVTVPFPQGGCKRFGKGSGLTWNEIYLTNWSKLVNMAPMKHLPSCGEEELYWFALSPWLLSLLVNCTPRQMSLDIRSR